MAEDEKHSKEGMISKTADSIAKVLQEVPIYKDALQPGAKKLGTELKPAAENIGKAVTTVTEGINLALSPLKLLVWSYIRSRILSFPRWLNDSRTSSIAW